MITALVGSCLCAPVTAAHFESSDTTRDGRQDPAHVASRVSLNGWVRPDPQDRTVNVRLDGPLGRKVVEDIHVTTQASPPVGVALQTAQTVLAEFSANLMSYPEVPAKPEALEETQETSTQTDNLATAPANLNALCGNLCTALAEFPTPLPETWTALAAVSDPN